MTELTVIAHRGFAGENPENTVGAVASAAGVTEDGRDVDPRPSTGTDPSPRLADLVEIDVVPTADGDVVAFHDDQLAGRAGGLLGLTDTEGIIWETDTETVTNAEVLNSGETVPLLKEVLEVLPSDVGLNVELKNPGSTAIRPAEALSADELDEQMALWQPFVERVLSVIAEHDTEVLVSSFCEAPIATCHELSSHPIAPIFGESVEDGLEIARRYDADAVHPPIEAVRGTPFTSDPLPSDADVVEAAHKDGRDVNVWTVTTWYEAAWLASAGADGVIADYSGLTRRWP
ncbi:glycerophosphodiester phosphodiesterase [Halorubrum sp. AD140]|uniref:glycerophosphodiester phosphodiesterase n=1 Tax=Halorubrum sp. AD140 TaxID=3050073 RepID=UPI002ACCDD91|nr:glycerophosphodiester phosphodiesterase [Halorubrum sp. AD140]MDZ5811912.1 glycerophosphodiester phosphodiesterase [Halorubrum sp. AD140]